LSAVGHYLRIPLLSKTHGWNGSSKQE